MCCCERACNRCLDELCESCCFAIGIVFKSFPALALICFEVCQEKDDNEQNSSFEDKLQIYKTCWTYTAFVMMIILFILLSFSILQQWTLLYYLIFPMIFIITINLTRSKVQDRKQKEIIQYPENNKNYTVNDQVHQIPMNYGTQKQYQIKSSNFAYYDTNLYKMNQSL